MNELATSRRPENGLRFRTSGFVVFLLGFTLVFLSACGNGGAASPTPTPLYRGNTSATQTPSAPTATPGEAITDTPATPNGTAISSISIAGPTQVTRASAAGTPARAPSGTAGRLPPVVVPGLGATTEQATLPTSNSPPALDLGPPAWVKAGTRLLFYNAAASVAQSRFAWVEDPNGTWVDPTTGKRYSRTDETGASVPTASGDGLSQIDVLALDGTNVVLSVSLYGFDRQNNQFVPSPGSGMRVPGEVVDGTWIHPARLAKLAEAQLNGVLILRGDYTLNGVTYQAISFANTTPGAYLSYTYDTKTGLLLSSTSNTAGATSPVTLPGQAPPQGNTQLTVTRFVGYRQRAVPGLDGKNPDWLARTSTLRYSGTYNFTNPVDPSSANVTYPMNLTASFTKGGPNWASYTAQTYVQVPGSQPAESSGVTGVTGLYWFDQDALYAMKSGQVLDQDPLTGERVVVKSVASQPGGVVVTIGTELPGIALSASYDQTSGVLVSYTGRFASTGATYQLDLQGRP